MQPARRRDIHQTDSPVLAAKIARAFRSFTFAEIASACEIASVCAPRIGANPRARCHRTQLPREGGVAERLGICRASIGVGAAGAK
jgi:hypothetical protein